MLGGYPVRWRWLPAGSSGCFSSQSVTYGTPVGSAARWSPPLAAGDGAPRARRGCTRRSCRSASSRTRLAAGGRSSCCCRRRCCGLLLALVAGGVSPVLRVSRGRLSPPQFPDFGAPGAWRAAPRGGVLLRLRVFGASGFALAALRPSWALAHWADRHRQSRHSVDQHLLHCLLPGFGSPTQASHGCPRPPVVTRPLPGLWSSSSS